MKMHDHTHTAAMTAARHPKNNMPASNGAHAAMIVTINTVRTASGAHNNGPVLSPCAEISEAGEVCAGNIAFTRIPPVYNSWTLGSTGVSSIPICRTDQDEPDTHMNTRRIPHRPVPSDDAPGQDCQAQNSH